MVEVVARSQIWFLTVAHESEYVFIYLIDKRSEMRLRRDLIGQV